MPYMISRDALTCLEAMRTTLPVPDIAAVVLNVGRRWDRSVQAVYGWCAWETCEDV